MLNDSGHDRCMKLKNIPIIEGANVYIQARLTFKGWLARGSNIIAGGADEVTLTSISTSKRFIL